MKSSILLIVLTFGLLTDGFSQSCLPDGITFTNQAQIDSFQINYPDCYKIEGDVDIEGGDINNLYGLKNVVSIGKCLTVEHTRWLYNLEGLNNLSHIGRALVLDCNTRLTSISALSKIDSIGYLIISCSGLTSLFGLQNLHIINNDLGIYNNDALTNLAELSGLSSIGGFLEVYYNDNLLSLDGLNNLTNVGEHISIWGNTSLTSISALSNTVLGNSGWKFVEITGNDALINLEGLNKIDSIGDRLVIESNKSLVSLSGLQNLRSVGGEFSIVQNDALNNIDALYNLRSVGGVFRIGFNSLSSLEGLNNLNWVGGWFSIEKCDDLTSLEGLTNLSSVMGEGIDISFNNSLLTLSGLNKIASISRIGITNNPVLNDISTLAAIDTAVLKSLGIINNPSLKKCDIESICNYLNLPSSDVTINNNATGCNSKEEVIRACAESVSEVKLKPIFTIYPNPATKSIFISGNNKVINAISIYNKLGQRILYKTKPINEVDISMLRQGVYLVEVIINENKFRKQLIVN